MNENPYSAPVESGDLPGSNDHYQTWENVTAPLRATAGWCRFLGLAFVILGAMCCATVIGAVVGWVPMWTGVLLLKAGDNLKTGTAESVNEAADQLAQAIRIMGRSVVVLVGVLLAYFACAMTMLVVLGISRTQTAVP